MRGALVNDDGANRLTSNECVELTEQSNMSLHDFTGKIIDTFPIIYRGVGSDCTKTPKILESCTEFEKLLEHLAEEAKMSIEEFLVSECLVYAIM